MRINKRIEANQYKKKIAARLVKAAIWAKQIERKITDRLNQLEKVSAKARKKRKNGCEWSNHTFRFNFRIDSNFTKIWRQPNCQNSKAFQKLYAKQNPTENIWLGKQIIKLMRPYSSLELVWRATCSQFNGVHFVFYSHFDYFVYFAAIPPQLHT